MGAEWCKSDSAKNFPKTLDNARPIMHNECMTPTNQIQNAFDLACRESYRLIARFMHDAASQIAHLTAFDATDTKPPFISDDSTDDLDAASDIISICRTAICDDDRDLQCFKLYRAIMTCDKLPELDNCLHLFCIDFNSPICDIMPDYDDCPNFK